MFNFGRKSTGPEYGVLFDIGSGTIGTAIVVSEKDQKFPRIIYAHRTTMRITKDTIHATDQLRRVREALFSNALTLSQEGYQVLREQHPGAQVTKIFVTCSSPWAYTVARNVHYEDDEPFKITNAIIQDLIKSAEEEILTYLHKETEFTKNGFEIVEQATVDITVNDYPVTNPLQLKGSMLSLSHIVGLIPKEVLEALREVQDKLFPDSELRAHTYMLVMYCVLRDILPKSHSLWILDVTAESTEFGIMENNLLIENSFIEYGSTSFLRDIMNKTGKPVNDVLTDFRMYEEENSIDATRYAPFIQQYEGRIKDAVTHLLERRTLPPELVVTAPYPYQHLFKEMIERAIKQATDQPCTVLTLDSHITIDVMEGIEQDAYLALGARFFHKLHGCGELGVL